MVEMKQIFELPFAPRYDPEMPVNVEESKRGVLCVLFHPLIGVSTKRVDADIMDLMKATGVITNMPHFLKFYELGNKMIIMNTENKILEEKAFSYNGEEFDMHGCMLICNKGFESLTQMEAMEILGSARLRITPSGLNMRVHIDIKE